MSGDFSAATIVWGANTITLLDLMKDILNIVDNTQDTELSLSLQAGGEACEAYIDNVIAETDVKENFTFVTSPKTIRYWPVSALVSVTVDGVDVTADWALYTQDGVAWSVRDTCNRIHEDCMKQMVVDYTAGYEPLPADLGYAVVISAIAYQEQQGSSAGAIVKESVVGVGSVEYATGADAVSGVGALNPTVIGSLEPYRRYSV